MSVHSILRSYTVLIGLIVLLAYPAYLWFSDGLIDPTGEILIGRDFANYHNASVLVVKGEVHRLFDILSYRAFLAEVYGQPFELNWSYPPHFLFFTLPLAGLPYLVAYAVWTLVGLGVYLAATGRHLRRTYDLKAPQLVLLVAAPATLVNAFFGQNGFITGTLLYVGVRYSKDRPALAGLCLGLLTIKPQLGLLIPIMLLLTRQWRTIAVAVITALIAIAASAMVFGTQSWIDYFEKVVPYQRGVMEEGTGLFLQMMPSAYGLGRLLDLPPQICLLLQLPLSLFALGLTVWLFLKPRGNDEATVLLFLLCTFMVTPYAFNYDMTALTPALLAYWASAQVKQPLSGAQKFLILSLFLMPGIIFGAPVGPFVLIASAWILLGEIRGRGFKLSHATP
nr:glycosyltransferase family 87 protein [Hyphomonas sp. Mor2]